MTFRSRRHFLQGSAAGLGAAGLTPLHASIGAQEPEGAPEVEKADKPLKMLILGGTGFLGPHTVRRAVARGHEITLFNRGKSNAHLFPELEKIKGNRDPDIDEGLRPLEGRKWDAVIDTSGYYERIVKASAELLAPNVGQYCFISSISVYPTFEKHGMDESSEVAQWEGEQVEEITNETYGAYKFLCERAATEAMDGNCVNIRPGLIVGPGDPTARFSYWPIRVERGGEVLAPGSVGDPLQWIDARDLANFMIHSIEQRLTGDYNAVGPQHPATIADLLYGSKAVTGGDARFTWVDADFLAEKELVSWYHLPVWADPNGEAGGINTVSNARGVADGMRFRPLADTVRGLLDWYHDLPEDRLARLRWALTPEKESEVLAAWHAR